MTKNTAKCRAMLIGPSKIKYKGRWGIRKPGRSIFLEYEVNNQTVHIDLKIGLNPEGAQEFAEWLSQAQSLELKSELPEGYYLAIRNDSNARDAVRSFRANILPFLKTSDYADYFERENFYCGDIKEPDKPDKDEGDKSHPWDDSSEESRQYIALDDGRVVTAIVWKEGNMVFLDYRVPVIDLDNMDMNSLIKYLSDQGLAVFDKPDEYKWSFLKKSEDYVLTMRLGV